MINTRKQALALAKKTYKETVCKLESEKWDTVAKVLKKEGYVSEKTGQPLSASGCYYLVNYDGGRTPGRTARRANGGVNGSNGSDVSGVEEKTYVVTDIDYKAKYSAVMSVMRLKSLDPTQKVKAALEIDGN